MELLRREHRETQKVEDADIDDETTETHDAEGRKLAEQCSHVADANSRV